MTHAELRKLCEETPIGPWEYYGDVVVGLTAECKCPEEPLLNEHAGIGYYVSGPPHECHDIIPGRFADDIEGNGLSFEQYISILKFCAAARTSVPALLEELERVYQVMEKQRRLEITPTISMVSHLEGWIVYHKGRAVNVDASFEIVYLPFQAALQRAWELERGT